MPDTTPAADPAILSLSREKPGSPGTRESPAWQSRQSESPAWQSRQSATGITSAVEKSPASVRP